MSCYLLFFHFADFPSRRKCLHVAEWIICVKGDLFRGGMVGIRSGVYPCFTGETALSVVSVVCLSANQPVPVFLCPVDLSSVIVIVNNVLPVVPLGCFHDGTGDRVILIIDQAYGCFCEGINGFFFVAFTEVIIPECCDNQVQRGGGSGIFLQSCTLNDPC